MNADLTRQLKKQAQELGFQLTGVCPAVTPSGFSQLSQWIEAGFAGEMHYIPRRRQAYRHPDSVLSGVRSLLMLGMNYEAGPAAEPSAGEGRVSRYAWGEQDYHDLIYEKLTLLCHWLRQQSPGANVRGVVDSAPLLEREFAQLAGLGWIGKNTLLLNKQQGSYFFLAALLTDLELTYDTPQNSDHCGTCTACLDACPTQAFPQPYLLDASRCLSYLTIELKELPPPELRGRQGNWLFGCDVCQEVCPWNHWERQCDEPAFENKLHPQELAELFTLDEASFRARFRKTPLWRPRRRGILRNAAIVLGNSNWPGAVDPLCRGLADEEPLVRAASVWALGHFLTNIKAAGALRHLQQIETEEMVLRELQALSF